MSGTSNMNSKKDKHVVGDCVKLNELINVELQNIAQTSSKMDEMDESTSITDVQTIIDIANIKKEITESTFVENPNMKFTVRVEVEEFNEDVKHKIKIEMHDIQQYVTRDESPEPEPPNQIVMENINIIKPKKPKQTIKSVVVDLTELYNEVDRIARTSNNKADKVLARELKNNWGSVLRRPVENDRINLRLQDVIHKWKIWINASRYRDVPLFYKCYLCEKAWWRLDPFRNHLKTHNINSFRIELEEHYHESNVIAYGTVDIPDIKYLKAEGDCWRCNKPFEQHIVRKKQTATYFCKCCDDRFYTCTNLKSHEGVCWQYLKHTAVQRYQDMVICELCQRMFATNQELDTHMITNHSVRSDQPVQSQSKVCSSCNLRYFIHALHSCNNRQVTNNCDKCWKGFATKFTLALHTLLTEENVKCEICPEILEKQCMEIEHYQNHSKMFKVAYMCSACTKFEVFFDENSFKKHRLDEHKSKNDKRRCHPEKVLLPITYFPDEVIAEEEREAAAAVAQKGSTDFPIFEAKDVKKTYQAKTKAYPEEEIQEAVAVIKQEMADVEDPSQEGCETLQTLDTGETSYAQMNENLITPMAIKTEIKGEPIDDEYEAIIVTINHPDQFIKEEPIEEITIEPETIYRETKTEPEMYKDQKPVKKPKGHSKYPCLRCNKSFHSSKKYLLHFRTHGVPYLTCPICYISFETMSQLTPHVFKHVKQTYVKLKVIDETSQSTSRRRSKGKKYQCRVCRSKVENDNLYGHWDTHFKTGWKKHDDEGVLNTALQSEGLQLVIKNLLEIAKEMKKKDCVICLRHFERTNDCKRHLIEHLLADAYCNRPTYGGLRCQVCFEMFQRQDKYKLHMRDHGSLPVYRCDLCDRAFSDSSNFTKHKKVHNLQVVICDVCNKKFQSKLSLIKHLEMHKTTKPITCPICFRVSHTESAYKKHVKRFHDRVVIRFRCHYCGKKFDSVKEKWDHLWVEHKERKYKADCPVCKKEFRKDQDLRTHMLVEHAIVKKQFKKKVPKKDDIEQFLRDNSPLEENIVYE